MPHIMINARGIGPIRFNGDEAKSLLDDQFARNALPHPIEFRGAVGRLAEKDDARRSDPVHQWIEIHLVDRLKGTSKNSVFDRRVRVLLLTE